MTAAPHVLVMQSGAGADKTNRRGTDLFFECVHCGTSLVVELAAAGRTLQCQRCGKPTMVPEARVDEAIQSNSAAAEKLAELQRHAKENESQRTEVKGYINQLSIQLHRWQLRLQTLEQRNQELANQIAALRDRAAHAA